MKDNKEHCEGCGEELDNFKDSYNELSKKYNLPTFKVLNDDFDISKIDCNTDTILRDVRKAMVGKFSSILQLVELLLNPSNGSMFHMFLVKGINGNEKESLNNLFELLGRIEIDSFELDINYNENNEADFIKANRKSWNGMKPKLNDIIASLKSNWKQTTDKKEKTYLG